MGLLRQLKWNRSLFGGPKALQVSELHEEMFEAIITGMQKVSGLVGQGSLVHQD